MNGFVGSISGNWELFLAPLLKGAVRVKRGRRGSSLPPRGKVSSVSETDEGLCGSAFGKLETILGPLVKEQSLRAPPVADSASRVWRRGRKTRGKVRSTRRVFRIPQEFAVFFASGKKDWGIPSIESPRHFVALVSPAGSVTARL